MIPPPGRQGGGSINRQVYVYLLRSRTTNRYYLGWTTNLSRRLGEHTAGQTSSTRNRGPWDLLGYEVYDDATMAKRREKSLKSRSRQLIQFKKRMLNMFRTASGGPGQVVG